ncbi:MAG: hypothetical protein SFV54_13635 [Bryobacteraceae bacterium]|nr:hypothetical protein [Bryobacteraceae bacterium]
MRVFLACLLALAPAPALAQTPITRGSTDSLEVKARAFLGKEQVKQLIGSDLDGFIAVVEVTLTPLTDRTVKIDRDDFLLRSERDGQRSGPFEPAQIAGDSALVVGTRSRGGGMAAEDRGPIFGGPGIGRVGRPNTGMVGTARGETEAVARVESDGKKKDNPLLATLDERILPEGALEKTVTGLLYFPLEGKHKPKDLLLVYKGEGGAVTVRFQDK